MLSGSSILASSTLILQEAVASPFVAVMTALPFARERTFTYCEVDSTTSNRDSSDI